MLALSGIRIDTPGTLTLQADTLALLTQTTQSDRSQTRHGSDLAWQKAKGEGTSDQTTHYNQFHVGTLATPVAQVQAGLGARDSVAALAQQPGMGWVQQITQDPQLSGKIDWATVDEAHTNWNYSQQGLTPAGAAVLTVVVAYFTAGAASGWGASVGQAAAVGAGEGVALAGGGAFLTGTGATISSVVGGAVTAAASALAGQAAVALANNQGNLGKTLDDLGSSASVKGLLTAIATGGVLGGLNLNPTGTPTTSGGAQPFMDQLGQNLQAGAARAVIGTAINGGSLQDNLVGALTTAFIDTAAAQGADAIGDWTESGTLNVFTNKVAHAMAGCAAGAVRSGDANGCGAGAIGASMGELAAELYGTRIDSAEFASMISAIAAALAGMDASQINLASQAGANAAANNYVSHSRDAEIRVTVAKENARLTQQCEASGCTQAKLDAIDQQMAALERVLTVQNKSAMTEQDAKELAQAVTELLPVYGSGESLLQLISGRSSITGEEASRFWAAVGVAPVVGGMVRKVGEPSVEALVTVLKTLAQQRTTLQLQQHRMAELTQLFGRSDGGASVTLGGKTYGATAESNLSGTTKVFDTTGLSAADLEQQVFAFAGELAGGRPIAPVLRDGLPLPGRWNAVLDDGTTVNVRSVSTSGVSRWTLEVQGSSTLQGIKTNYKGDRYEIKFK